MNVYSTLNVQHLESLNDIVAQITGIVVRETLPDKVMQMADEVELIDLPPDDLLKRLGDGKVYLPDAAQRASQNFFRKGNLIALREIALRTTADRVNDQVQVYRRDKSITQTWATADRLLVCVGPSPSSASLVRATHRMAKSLQGRLDRPICGERRTWPARGMKPAPRPSRTFAWLSSWGRKQPLSADPSSPKRSWITPVTEMSPRYSWESP